MLFRELHVRCDCGGEVKNNVSLTVTEEEKLEVSGYCNKCPAKVYGKYPLTELLLIVPARTDSKRFIHH